MPKTKLESGMGILVRKKILKERDWIELIQKREEHIKPQLKSFTLPRLGSLECMQSDRIGLFYHKLIDDHPIEYPSSEHTLLVQGIFSVARHSENYGNKGKKYIYGLTRSNDWIIAEVVFSRLQSEKYEKALNVKINKVSLEDILDATKEDPKNIWKMLGDQILAWKKACQERLDEISKIAAIVSAENFALSFIPTGVRVAHMILAEDRLQELISDLNSTELKVHYHIQSRQEQPNGECSFDIIMNEAAAPLFYHSLKDGMLRKWKSELLITE